ncbi:Borealin%2C partial [Xyrichtys novacula]|uniref:Borealin, partial n=1 Tax=Xyrichtys novacula TaxID=13765 RepID=A0AAV1G6P4_XYRNO|nr:Borealin%2C partial [Xyrichtys novacula]
MAVCADCKIKNSRLEEKLCRLQNDLREKDRLLEGFISVASAQAKHISLSQASRITGLSPSALAPQLVSASAATLPWLASLHSPIGPAEGPAAEGPAGSPVPHSAKPAGCLSTSPPAHRYSQDLRPLDDPDTGMVAGLPALPTHSSTPKLKGQQTWLEVAQRGRRTTAAERVPSPPRLSLSNRFLALRDEAPAVPVPAPAPPLLTVPAPAEAAPRMSNSDLAPRPSSTGILRRRLLKEAVSRRSERLPRAGNNLTPPASAHCRQSPSPAQVERPTSEGFSACTPAPHPLFPPTTLIIGDSITRYIRFFNAITHCFPGATVPVILDKLLNLLPSLPSSVTKIVLHVGSNDMSLKQSETTKRDFNLLFNVLKDTGKTVFISGPIPTLGRGGERFSRILSLHTWLQSTCPTHNFGFIDNFNLFWDRASLFSHDGIHPNRRGSRMLSCNIQYMIHSSPV